ncbi:Uncharacterised protein [Legionella beliardensis]|uniref:Uncharacterized protein n=1 Tax=Legionella beliardensis TaxID=91822 RepID=A0A378I3X8_9GAMM|nr:hypothetical protein [Legionella beliardensis]STX29396.1 Uncharacterised protein [Legionella beliardensis]
MNTSVESRIADYYKLGFKRNKSLFSEFLPKGYAQVTLNQVPADYFKDLINTKILLGLFITLCDDFVDNPTYANPKLINELAKIPLDDVSIDTQGLTEFESKVVSFAKELFQQIISFLQKLPHFDCLKMLLYFDIKQFFNGLHYSQLIRIFPQMTNTVECACYLPHNMGIIIVGMMDLMAIADFDINEFGIIREFFWFAQRFSNICNTLTTFERELNEHDFGNEIMLLSAQENRQGDIGSYQEAKEKLIAEQLTIIDQIALYQINSFSTLEYIKGLKYLQSLHQSMQGFI